MKKEQTEINQKRAEEQVKEAMDQELKSSEDKAP